MKDGQVNSLLGCGIVVLTIGATYMMIMMPHQLRGGVEFRVAEQYREQQMAVGLAYNAINYLDKRLCNMEEKYDQSGKLKKKFQDGR